MSYGPSPEQVPDEVGTDVGIPELVGVSAEIAEIVARARSLEVTTDAQAQEASVLLIDIKSRKDRTERARKYLTKKPREQINELNAICKATAAPLVRADEAVRDKLGAFISEQERLRAEEQARLDAQRKLAEEQAAAERKRAEEAARAAEREAEEKAARAREVASLEEVELELQMSALDDDVLLSLDVAGTEKERVVAHRLREQRVAERVAAAKRREAEEATQRSIAAQAAPALAVAAPPRLGGVSVRHEWKATAIDRDQLPPEYLIPDTARINREVKAKGADCNIPGVTVERVTGTSVSGNG